MSTRINVPIHETINWYNKYGSIYIIVYFCISIHGDCFTCQNTRLWVSSIQRLKYACTALFVSSDSLCHSQQFFNSVGTGLILPRVSREGCALVVLELLHMVAK